MKYLIAIMFALAPAIALAHGQDKPHKHPHEQCDCK